jgi:hypothetical protein
MQKQQYINEKKHIPRVLMAKRLKCSQKMDIFAAEIPKI